MEETVAQLQGAAIPLSEAPCRGCPDPCDAGHEELPKLDIDMSPLLGNVKPYGRQVIISTPNPDWAREVTEAPGTLAGHLAAAVSAAGGTSGEQKAPKPALSAGGAPPGVFDTQADLARLTRVSIHNGRFPSVSADGAKETALVFPDYRAVTEVAVSEDGAREVFEKVLSPGVPLQDIPGPPAGTESGIKTWVLPYTCVILICSHKKRDYRCWAVAPQLENAFTQALEREGFEVHYQLEDPSLSGPALEDDPALQALPSADAKRAELRRRLQQQHAQADEKRALVLFCSHVGQHKFAGNVIINMPTGASVWYGRVTPHEVDAIVRETVLGGKVLPALLRGGLNLCHPRRGSLNDW